MSNGVSVCMATFNGARYIKEQVDSILREIALTDELIIVDDASNDETVRLLEEYHDPRIRLFQNPVNRGHVRAFERAISLATLPLIMLSDQDDIWPSGRVAYLAQELQAREMVLGKMSYFGTSGVAAPDSGNSEGRNARNIMDLLVGRAPYFGCAMAFRRELLRYVLPFPRHVEAHDHWLALVGNMCGRVARRDSVVVFRRIHDSNMTPRKRRSPVRILWTRVLLASLIVQCAYRRFRWHQSYNVRSEGN